ncbi:MAG: hypothetical protein WC262_11590, partial [Bacteroidales bacterium]
LTKLGYSQAQIAAAYAVSKRAVWQSLNAAATPREQGKLERFRIKYPAGKKQKEKPCQSRRNSTEKPSGGKTSTSP